VVIEGMEMVHRDGAPALELIGSNHCRFTRNRVDLNETESEDRLPRLSWIEVRGENSHHNRIDHNLFENKRNSGRVITTGGSRVETNNQSTRYDRIDHNHFRNIEPG